MLTSFSVPSASAAPASTAPAASKTPSRLALSTFTGCSWSRRTLAPGTAVFVAASFINWISSSSLPVIRIRLWFLGSLATAAHLQFSPTSFIRTSCSMARLSSPTCVLLRSSSVTLVMSIVQNGVSVKYVADVFVVERPRRLLG